jgi:hypothetical protein
MDQGLEEVRAVLAAYKRVKDASWPNMHAAMAKRSAQWATASEAELRAELAGYVKEASLPSCTVRVFWKTGADYVFSGCNDQFAHDAGAKTVAEIIGWNDFHDRIPWKAQASKYRFDDKEVVDSNVAKLDILERQASAAGVVWVLVGKAPIRTEDGRNIGVLSMYQLIDNDTATRLYRERSRKAGG